MINGLWGGKESGKVELLKLVVNGRSVFKSPPNLPVRHGSGPVDAPTGIVVARLDPWTPCHASTISSPVVDSPSYKKKDDKGIKMEKSCL